MAKLYSQYQRLMDSGEYSSVNEMCNDLALNYDDVYDYSEEEQWGREDSGSSGSTSRRRRR